MATIPYREEIVEMVKGQIQNIELILTQALGNQEDLVEQLQQQLASFTVELGDLDFRVRSIDIEPFSGEYPSKPSIDTSIAMPFPEDVQLTEVDPGLKAVPDIPMDAPEIVDRGDIAIRELEFTDEPPSISGQIDRPLRPTLLSPTAPTAPDGIEIRAFEGFYIPQFEGVFPEDNLGELEYSTTFSEPIYTTTTTEKIRTWLENVIENGGTGLGTEVLAAMRSNFLSWLNETLEEEYEQVFRMEASRGFSAPTGSLQARLRTLANKRDRKLTEYENQLLSEEAKLAQANTQFAVQFAIQHEQVLREFFNQVANRLLQSVKDGAEVAIGIYNARVGKFSVMVNAYQVRGQVYKILNDALLVLIEEYKAEIEAKGLLLSSKEKEVQIYLGLLQANRLLVDQYNAEWEGARLELEADKNQLLLYKERIDAFIAQVGAAKTPLETRLTLLESDKARYAAWAEKMKGYGILVESITGQNQIALGAAQLDHEVLNKGKLDIYNANIAKVDAMVKDKIALQGLKLEKYKTEGAVYEAEAKAYGDYTDGAVKAYSAEYAYAVAMMDKILKEADIRQTGLIQTFAAKLETLKQQTNVYAQTIASCLSALNNSLSLGYSGGYSVQESWQPDIHVNETHQHIYEEEGD